MTSPILQWKLRVTAHHEQSSRMQRQASWKPADFWDPFAFHFKADPRRADDAVLNRLRREVGREATVLDVGGGAGRFALPLALACRHVTVVEPSPTMVQWLHEGARELGLSNLSIIQGAWEDTAADPQDLALCAYVLHEVTEIEMFVRKLTSHAKRRVVILEHMESPDSLVAPVWEAVHGEELAKTPSAPDLLGVLGEMNISPDVEMFEAPGPETVQSHDEALQVLRHLLYVKPATAQDQVLQAAMDELLVDTPHGLTLRGARPGSQALISWGV